MKRSRYSGGAAAAGPAGARQEAAHLTEAALPPPGSGAAGLNAEDSRVWRQVARTVRPLSRRFAAAEQKAAARRRDGAPAETVREQARTAAETADKSAAAKSAAKRASARPGSEILRALREQLAAEAEAARQRHLPPKAAAAARPAAGQSGAAKTAPAPGGFDTGSYRRLARGRLPIEGRLDLHNYTQAEAHDALLYFIRGAQARGRRYVLIITGKGRTSGSEGILRGRLPHWLAQPPFRSYVAAVEQAARAHGGEGAFYVRLRRLALNPQDR